MLIAVLTVALAGYALDCVGMTTPEQAMQCCNSMRCPSHGHHGQDCCKSMPSIHVVLGQPSSLQGVSLSPIAFGRPQAFHQSEPSAFAHEGDFNFTWGFYRNFDLTILLPIMTNHFEMVGTPLVGGTGFGDAMVLVKYRFYRRDSQRGTTQASITAGPKAPTGETNLKGTNGSLLPATLQPGSGSTDLSCARRTALPRWSNHRSPPRRTHGSHPYARP
jgi:hypothetical protein